MMGLAAAAAASILLYMAYQQQPSAKDGPSSTPQKSLDRGASSTGTSTTKSSGESVSTDLASNTAAAKRVAQKNAEVDGKMDDKALHAKIEEMDKKGKALFKNKQVRKSTCMFNDYSLIYIYV